MGLGVEAKVDVIGDTRREAPVSSITRSRHSWLVPLSMTRRLLGKQQKQNAQHKTKRTVFTVVTKREKTSFLHS